MSTIIVLVIFQLDKKDYDEIKEEMLTNPEYDLDYDEELAEKKTLKKWGGARLSKNDKISVYLISYFWLFTIVVISMVGVMCCKTDSRSGWIFNT